MMNNSQLLKSFLAAAMVAGGLVTAQATIHSYTVSFGPASGVITSGTGAGIALYATSTICSRCRPVGVV
jgi:hypothetical protein